MSRSFLGLRDHLLQDNFPFFCRGGLRTAIDPTVAVTAVLVDLVEVFGLNPSMSLGKSPAISPMAITLYASLPLPPGLPSSVGFFTLSRTPPTLTVGVTEAGPRSGPPVDEPVAPKAPGVDPMTVKTVVTDERKGAVSHYTPLISVYARQT